MLLLTRNNLNYKGIDFKTGGSNCYKYTQALLKKKNK